jgi:hypothetical protein
MAEIVAMFLLTLSAFCLGWIGCEYWLRRQSALVAVSGNKRCEVCATALPKSAIRSHDGRWLCARHKHG